MKKDGKERMLYCPDCGAVEYPKISPAVIIAVTHKNRLLLSKYAGRSYKNMPSSPALWRSERPWRKL